MNFDGQKRFSLLDNGILDQLSTKLLLINVSVSLFIAIMIFEEADKKRQGMNDEGFLVEESMILLQHGDVDRAREISCDKRSILA